MGGWRWGALVMTAIGGCGGGGVTLYVDAIDDGLAVVEGADGRVRTVEVRRLPEGAREGAVLVDGSWDAEAERALVARVRNARARHGVRRVGSLDLPAPTGSGRLTSDRE